MYACQECGHKFRTTKAAERAANDGCPKCGGVDVDLDVEDQRARVRKAQEDHETDVADRQASEKYGF